MLGDFPGFARCFWKILDKEGIEVPFVANAAQALIYQAAERQHLAGKPVRLRILKYRQAGVSLYCTLWYLFLTMTTWGLTALSLADKHDLPAQWLRRCKRTLDQLDIKPHMGATNANELWFDKLQSRYYIGSAEGTTPGMGHTIRAVHCSEIASWLHPDEVLSDLLPALPPGPNTYVVQESTGRNRGDWWYRQYFRAKRGEDDYQALFLPWYIQPEYVDDADEILAVAEDEKALVACGVTKAQLAWRRKQIRDDFHGELAAFSNQFPATEAEAFLAGGRNVFNAEQVAAARKTVREPIWRGDLLVDRNPAEIRLAGSDGGQLLKWEHPVAGMHYAIGADCQWGAKDTNDYDSAYVECVETGKVAARFWGRMDMGAWAKSLAGLSHHYNLACLAPERNSAAARGVILPLLGLAGNDWRYPNLFVRDRIRRFGARGWEDYGFLTDEHSKPELVVLTKELLGTERGMDWADAGAVEELEAYIVDDANKFTAPEGQHDDRLMARMIAAKVAQVTRGDLHVVGPKVPLRPTRSMDERVAEQLGLNEVDGEAEDVA